MLRPGMPQPPFVAAADVRLVLKICWCGMEMVQVAPLRRTQASSFQSECASCHQQGHMGSKTFLQQNPPVLE